MPPIPQSISFRWQSAHPNMIELPKEKPITSEAESEKEEQKKERKKREPKPKDIIPGLKPPQVLVLKFLNSYTFGSFSRSTISDETGVAEGTLCPALGSLDAEMRRRAELRGRMYSLLTMGYVSAFKADLDGITEVLYKITDKGREAYRNHLAECAQAKLELDRLEQKDQRPQEETA